MLVYLGPFLIDAVLFLVSFAVLYRAGELHLSNTQCAWLGLIISLIYMPFSLLAGHILNQKNCKLVLILSTIGTVICGICSLIFTSFYATLVFIGLLGGVAAFYFNSFQAFIRGETVAGELTKAIAFYTLAWSSGIALGFISSGSLYTTGIPGLSILIILAGIIVVLVTTFHRSTIENHKSAEEHTEQDITNSVPVNPVFVWIGWILLFTISFIQRPIHTFFPVFSANTGLSAFLTSLPLFSMLIAQAITGYFMKNFRNVLYRQNYAAIVQSILVLILFIIWLYPRYIVYFIGFTLIGSISGFLAFVSVYYANNDPRNRARNVGINEFMTGVGAVVGVIVCNWGMKFFPTSQSIYLVCILYTLLIVIVQYLILSLPHPTGKRK